MLVSGFTSRLGRNFKKILFGVTEVWESQQGTGRPLALIVLFWEVSYIRRV
jgi:hypothetical protein